MGYIYILTSPSGKSYIGQTIDSIKKRFAQHQRTKSCCTAIHNAIKKYGWENLEKDWYECPDDDLDVDEELLIREMGTLAPGGYNLKEGGGNGKLSEETKEKISIAQKGCRNSMFGKGYMISGEKHYLYGKHHTEEVKQKISKSGLGKTRTDETKQRISKANKGERSSLYGKTGANNVNSRKIYQYDLQGNFIQTFSSCNESAQSLSKKSHSLIARCARGERNTAYGFKWSYELFN